MPVFSAKSRRRSRVAGTAGGSNPLALKLPARELFEALGLANEAFDVLWLLVSELLDDLVQG